MKFRFLLIGLALIAPGAAYADYFQFFAGGRSVPHARVILNGKTVGFTDAYGRVKINLPRGAYQVQIDDRVKRMSARIVVDGKGNLKRADAI